MSFTKIVIALAGMLAVLFGYITIFNRDDTTIVLWSGHSATLPTSVLMSLCVLAGALFILVLVGFTELGAMFRTVAARSRQRREERYDSLYRKGCDAADLGHVERATSSFERLLDRNAGHVPTLTQLGNLNRERGEFDRAIGYHKHALEVEPDNVRALLALADDYVAAERWQEAVDLCRRILEVDAQADHVLLQLRDHLARLGQFDAAIEVQRQINRRDLEKGGRLALARLQFERAAALRDAGEADAAKRAFSELVKNERRFAPAYVEWGRLLLAEGKGKEAAARWREGYGQTHDPVFLHLLESYFLEREDPDTAISVYLNAIKDAPARADLQFYLGKLYFRLEMLDNAYETFRDLVDAGTSFPALHQLFGEVKYRRGECDESFQELQLALPFPHPATLPYRCAACSADAATWTARCSECGAWESLRLPVETVAVGE
ncbi:MAG: tetratricopeptide repeat protein [Nitrospirota bacterium]|jgi:lipopolysaccharide biosynthesis regulator YciM